MKFSCQFETLCWKLISRAKPATIDDLPPEMICKLFEHLHPKDLAACFLVNKRWHSIYAGYRLQRLFVLEGFSYGFNEWNYPDPEIEDKELCNMKTFGRFVDQPLLSNLKHLALCSKGFEFDLNRLNQFSQLLHLEIIFDDLGREQVKLKLPKLKVLEFRAFNKFCPLLIDCPQLNALIYRGEPENVNLLDVRHPETIRKLDTRMFGPKLALFSNVELLITQAFGTIKKEILQLLPRLKALHFDGSIKDVLYHEFRNAVGSLDRLKLALTEFWNNVRLLRGSDFQFRFSGFKLTETTLNQIDFGLKVYTQDEYVSNEYVYIKNHRLIEPDATLEFICSLDYTSFMSNGTGQIPDDFFKRFTGLRWVNIREVSSRCCTSRIDKEFRLNEKHILCFLKSLRSLRRLFLHGPEMSQQFWDELAGSSKSLISLKLGRDEKGRVLEFDLHLNFDFIGKLPRLSQLDIDQNLSFESLTSLIRHLNKLTTAYLNFRLNEQRFVIQKFRYSKKWMVSKHYYEKIFETENPEKILTFFKKLELTSKCFGHLNHLIRLTSCKSSNETQ